MEGYKNKKPTKKQAMENISNHVEKTLNEGMIKNMMHGFEISNQMILDYINQGHTLEEVKDFVEKNIEKKDILEKVVKGFK